MSEGTFCRVEAHILSNEIAKKRNRLNDSFDTKMRKKEPKFYMIVLHDKWYVKKYLMNSSSVLH